MQASERTFRIGSVSVNIGSGTVLKDGTAVFLRAKSFLLLRHLLLNAGRVVTRDEIVDTIWDGRAITDDALNQTIRDIRRAIGDSAAASLRTVPKRGYMLSADDLTEVTARQSEQPSTDVSSAPPRRPTVAVARPTCIGVGAQTEDLIRGVADDIVALLSHMPSIRVFPDTSAPVEARTSDYILDGSVRGFGDRLRITAHLRDVDVGASIWGEHFDGTIADVGEVMDRMAGAAVAAIESSIRLSEIEKAQRKTLNEADAYDLLMRAVPISVRNAVASSQQAIELLEQSLALDPGSALAHGYKAWAHQQLFYRGGFHGHDREAALRHAEAAVRLGPRDPQALALGGFVQGFLRNDFSAAIALLDRALSLNPNSPLALRFSGMMHAFSFKVDRALHDARTALKLAPLDPMNYHVYVTTSFCGIVQDRWDMVAEEAAVGIAINPDFPVLHAFRAAGLLRIGRRTEAEEAIARLRAVAPGFTVAALARMGFIPPVQDRLLPALLAAGMVPN